MPSKSSTYEMAKEAMAMATSVAASIMLARNLANELLPHEALDLLNSGLASLRSRTTWRHTIIIEQNEGWYTNQVFHDVKTYLASRMEAARTTYALQRLRLSSDSTDDEDPDKLVVGMEEGEEMPDVHEGTEFRWTCTTNYKERLDPALLRPGRMDMHIYMGYCTPEAVRILVNNYHSIEDPDTYSSDDDKTDQKEIEALMAEIEELIAEVEVTPAEVAETLMRSEIPRVSLLDLIELLKSKKECSNNKEEEEEEGDGSKEEEEEEEDGDDSKEEEDGDDAKNDNADDSSDQWLI